MYEMKTSQNSFVACGKGESSSSLSPCGHPEGKLHFPWRHREEWRQMKGKRDEDEDGHPHKWCDVSQFRSVLFLSSSPLKTTRACLMTCGLSPTSFMIVIMFSSPPSLCDLFTNTQKFVCLCNSSSFIPPRLWLLFVAADQQTEMVNVRDGWLWVLSQTSERVRENEGMRRHIHSDQKDKYYWSSSTNAGHRHTTSQGESGREFDLQIISRPSGGMASGRGILIPLAHFRDFCLSALWHIATSNSVGWWQYVENEQDYACRNSDCKSLDKQRYESNAKL